MSYFVYEDENIPFQAGETVLAALLRANKDVSYSCKKGTCLSCMRKGEGPIDAAARTNLTAADKTNGFFLMCQTAAQNDIRIFKEDEGQYAPARIKSVTPLSKNIYKVLVTPEDTFHFKAGQFVSLILEDGLARSYSIASLSDEKDIELHVRYHNDGQMTSWLCKAAKAGDSIKLRGPYGHCYYNLDDPTQPILLVGTSTGLAPLYGILQDALRHGHTGDIYIYHGSRFSEDLYYFDELKALDAQNKNVHYIPCVSREYADNDIYLGRAGNIAKQKHPNLGGWKVYLCGSPAMVQDMQQACFIQGANLDDILTDPFELMDLRRNQRA